VNRPDTALSVIGVVILAIILALAFRAYLSPAMILDFATLQLCS
jgi:hypothetical protein